MAHAKLSPSASATWMTCPGSVHLPPDPGSDKSSEYAAKGTTMHSLSEKALSSGVQPSMFLGQVIDGYTIDQTMVDITTTYVEFVRSLPGLKRFEVKVSVQEIIQDCYGTADMLAMRPLHLTVGDLKTGSGNRVDAKDNTQLLIYALGAFLKFDPLYDFESVSMVIVQPPMENISTWTISRSELLEFADQLREAERRINEEPETYVLSEKGCKWCRSKSSCPEQRKLASQAAAIDFKTTKDDLSDYMSMVDHLRGFCDAVENAVKEKLLAGVQVPGWKVVEGRRSRSWKDENVVKAALLEQGLTNIFTQPKLLSVAQMETALKKTGVDLEQYIEVKAGNPTVARESDGRSSTNKAEQAAKDFAN